MSEATPEDFDLDAWLSGASRPTRSVQIYQRGDMLATLDELARKIELAEAVGDEERSLTDPSPARLRATYAQLSEDFAESALNVRIHAHSEDERKEIIAGRKRGDMAAIYRDLVHAALTFPVMPREKFDAFLEKIGPGWDKLKAAYDELCAGYDQPSADFLPHASTQDEE